MAKAQVEVDAGVEVVQREEARERKPFRNGYNRRKSATSTSSDAAGEPTVVVGGCRGRGPLPTLTNPEDQSGCAVISTTKRARRRRRRRRWRWRPAEAVAAGLFCCTRSGVSGLLQLDQVPNRITNQRSATFTYVCTLLDAVGGCDVKWSLDSDDWEPAAAANASVTVQGLLDGVHSLSLKHDYVADGRAETESVDYTWTVDTVPPETIVDTGPSQEGEAPRPEEADPFLLFTFHCSEDSCYYRYQFDNRLELTATWEGSGDGLEGQVAVTSTQQQQQQATGGSAEEEDVFEKLQISVFLTAASSDSERMPATVSIFETGGVVAADGGEEAGGDGSSSGSSGRGGEVGVDNNSTSLETEISSSTGSSVTASSASEGGEEALVVMTLGSPEVDSGTGNTVFSLSAEVEVPELIELNSTLVVKVFTNDSILLASAPLEESITSKEWLRWPYASELPGSHMVAIAAVDEAGNVDPEPAVWKWSVDARPRTSLTSAPQAVTAANEAFFSFACALPGAEADPSPLDHGTLSYNNNSVEIIGTTVTTSDAQAGTTAVASAVDDDEGDDGGWEIQEGGECTYFFSLDGGNYSAVEPAAAVVSSTGGGAPLSSTLPSSSSSLLLPSSTNTLLLTGLADGFHELSVYACKANSTECDPQPLSHSWETDTSPPVTSIVSFPDKLTPSVFSFGSTKPLSRFMCKLDSGLWRQCLETSEFPLSDGQHSLVVMAVDPTGRSDPNPVTHSWEVSMLETVVEYCPPSHLRSEATSSAAEETTQEDVQVLLGASYGGVSCASAMSCQIRYVLEWEAAVPASAGGECVAPPSPAPTFAPAAPWSPSPVTSAEEGEGESSDGGSGDGDEGASGGNGDSSGGGGSDNTWATPAPTEIGGAFPSPSPVGQNYLSRSAVECLEAWANCTTVEANTSYYGGGQLPGAASEGSECTKLETLVGEVGHSHGTLVMRNLPVGAYNLTLEAFNVFGVVDRSPVVCPFQVLAEGESVNQTQIVMVRTPAKVLNSPDQAPVLFEFEVEDVPADNSSSAAASPRLSYLISGPGARDAAWEAVPAVPRDEWDALVLLAGDHNGTSSMFSSSFRSSSTSSSSAAVGSGGGSSSDGFVWGLELEGLVDGEYRLQVRDEILGDTAEYTWKADMSVPQLSLDSTPQNPSHSAVSILMLRCSKLSCGLEYQVTGDGVWHLWDAAAAEIKHTHGSRAPTPAPTLSHGSAPSTSSWEPHSGSESSDAPGGTSSASQSEGPGEGEGSSGGSGDGHSFGGNHVGDDGGGSGSGGSSSGLVGGIGGIGAYDDRGDYGDDSSSEQEDAVVVSISAQQVSSHELAFRVNVTVPESGNYSFAARPFSSSTPVYAIGPSVASDDSGDGDDDDDEDRRRRDRLLGSASAASSSAASTPPSSPSSASASDQDSGAGSDTLTVDWEVDLTRPETKVVSRPGAVTTAGVAAFQFACSLAGEEPREGCFYQYQMMAVNVEADWDSREWLPTADSVKLYEIGEGVNRIRVRAHDAETELYDLAPAEVVWVRDATPPEVDWLWTPEEVSHLSGALFEFTCSGELPLSSAVFGIDDEEDAQDPSNEVDQGEDTGSMPSSSASPSLRSSSSSSSTAAASGDGNDDGYASSSTVVGAAALGAAYPTAFPRVLPSGCAFEASLDDADFEAVPNAVSLVGLSNGDHRFSVRASDLAGNVAATSHFDWTVDTNVPDTVLVAGPADVTSSTMGSFRILDTVGAQQGQGHFEYRLDPVDDDAPWESTSNVTLAIGGLQDGRHVLTVRAREAEAEGGSSDQVPEVVVWTVDTECPDTTFVVLPEVVTHLTSTVFVVEGGPDAASFEYALDPADTTVVADADADGSEASSGSTMSGDAGAGSASGGGGGASSSSSSSSSLAGGHAEEGAVVWQKGDSSGVIHLHELEEGRHEIRVRAVDSAGNADPSPATYSWIVDRAGVYGHPSMVTDVGAEGGNKQAFVQWSAVADDGGGALTKYVVIAATAYADINVETITQVYPTTAEQEEEQEEGEGLEVGVLPTEATVTGLTNGLVYSFQVVATNAFGSSTLSLPSNKVLTFDPADPCGLVTCGDHGSCFIQRSASNALRGYCVCRPGYSGSDCSVVASGTDENSLVLGAYPGSWGECDMKCGGGVRYRTVQCLEYLEGIPMAPPANETACWEEMTMMAEDDVAVGTSHVQAMSETSCRNVACLAMFLDVTMRLRAFYDDACFTVAAQDAFLSGFAAEVAHALNIKVELVIDLNAFHTEKHNEMEVRFIIAPGQTGADQPIENLREQLLLQAASETSSFRSHGTWTRKLIPDSVEVSQGTYELPPLNVTGIASDLVMILMLVGTTCLGVAVYGACASRNRSKKWESVYDGEYGYRDGPQSPGTPSNGGGRTAGSHNIGDDSIFNRRIDANGCGSGGGSTSSTSSTSGTGGSDAAGRAGGRIIGGGGGGRGLRRNRWFELEDDSEDCDSEDDDWDDEDEEDETSPFFGRCALRSLLCRDDYVEDDEDGDGDDDDTSSSCRSSGQGSGAGGGGRRRGRDARSGCSCACECGGSTGGIGGREGAAGSTRGGGGGGGRGCPSGCCCSCTNGGIVDDIELTQGPTIDPTNVDPEKLPLPIISRTRPPPPLSSETVLHRRRGRGLGGNGTASGSGSSGTWSGDGGGGGVRSSRDSGSSAAPRDEEGGIGDAGGAVVRGRGVGGSRGGSGAGVRDLNGLVGIQRPGRQAMV